jgi:putative spermidine/putrescine transport system substrate-binding protein
MAAFPMTISEMNRNFRPRSLAGALRRAGLLFVCIALVAACGDRGSRGADGKGGTKAPVAVGEGRLDILAWPGFALAADGSANDAWLRPFEKATACEVHVQRVGTAADLLASTDKKGIDLVIATSDVSLLLAQSGRVQPLDVKRVPALAGVFRPLSSAASIVDGGVRYGVPLQWQAMRYRYDRALFANRQVPASARDFFEPGVLPDGRSNAGRIGVYEQPMAIAEAALYLADVDPNLGISDPYALDETQYAAALEVLRAQRALAAAPNATSVLGGNWPDQLLAALSATTGANDGNLPAGIGTGWLQASMLHAKARHPNCAMAWMQWSLQPAVQAAAAESFATLPVVAAACTGSDKLGRDWCAAKGVDAIGTVRLWRTPTARCGAKSCVPYSRWVRDVAAIRSMPATPASTDASP